VAKDPKTDAHNKGQEDSNRYAEHGINNPLGELINPTYRPPSGHEDDYKEGWDNADKVRSSGGKK